jgi:hypothetical protein
MGLQHQIWHEIGDNADLSAQSLWDPVDSKCFIFKLWDIPCEKISRPT